MSGDHPADLKAIGDGTQGCQGKVGDRPAMGCSGSQLGSRPRPVGKAGESELLAPEAGGSPQTPIPQQKSSVPSSVTSAVLVGLKGGGGLGARQKLAHVKGRVVTNPLRWGHCHGGQERPSTVL